MSASTRTIQQPISRGSILGAVLMAAAVLFAVVAISWGATNLVATKAAAPPVPAPILLDKGSRGELEQKAPLSVGGYGGPRMGSSPRGTIANPDRLKDDAAFGSSSSGAHGGLRAQ
jgi:hypothetical protein